MATTKSKKVSKGSAPTKKSAGANSAKGSKGAKKSAAAKPAKAAKKSARAKIAAPALSVSEKQRLLKPLNGYGDLIGRLVSVWKEHGRVIKVPGLTPAALAARLKRAQRASEREDALRARLTARLQPLADARMRAEHEAWKSALDLHAMVKTAARTDPALGTPFEFFGEAFARRRSSASESEPEAVVAGGEE
jgi:hypothetical protein